MFSSQHAKLFIKNDWHQKFNIKEFVFLSTSSMNQLYIQGVPELSVKRVPCERACHICSSKIKKEIHGSKLIENFINGIQYCSFFRAL